MFVEGLEKTEHVKKVAGLLRISTEKTDTKGKKVDLEETLKNHKEKITDFVTKKKWECDFFEEVLSGGTEYEERPELQRLLNTLEQYQAIVVIELARLARQGLVSQHIKEKAIKHGVLIITMNPPQVIDLSNYNEALIYDIGGAVSEYERKVASSRVKTNKMSMSRQGLNSSGSVAFGYKRTDEKKLDIIEEEAAIVRKIFDWYIEGIGQAKICEMLNDMGIKNKQGNKWVPQSLRYLLQCKTYKGTLVAHSYGMKHGKRVVIDYVEEPNIIPKIIQPEIWEKAQQIRNVKKERYDGTVKRARERTERKHTSILHDLVFCACCKRKSTIKWVTPRQAHYIRLCPTDTASGKTCSNGGSKLEWVEAAVIQKVLDYKKELEVRRNKFKANDFEDSIKELEEDHKLYSAKLQRLMIDFKHLREDEKEYKAEKELTGIEDAFLEEEIANDKKENQQQRLKIQAKLQELEKKINSAPSPEKEIEKINEKISFIEQLENADLDEAQVNYILKQFILKIHYKRILPENIAALGNKNPIRNNYPAEIEIEYID